MIKTAIGFRLALVIGTAAAGPAALDKWHHEEEEQVKQHYHEAIVEHCGHDVQVVFDWKSFNIADWDSKSVGGFCATNMLQAIEYECTVPEAKAAAAKIKTLTCHYKKCSDLPPSFPGQPKSGPGYDYKITAKGTNIDEWYCEKTSIQGDYDSRRFLSKTL